MTDRCAKGGDRRVRWNSARSGSRLSATRTQRLVTGQGRFSDDFSAAGPSLRRDGALASPACPHPGHRRGARQGDAGRARRLHRRRLPGRQARADPARSAAQDQIRHEAARARAAARSSSARTCCCRPTRPAMSARRWRWWWRETHGAGARRRRGGRGRLRGAAGRLSLRRRDEARRAGDLGRGARQHRGRYALRRPRSHRQGLRRRRPCRVDGLPHRPRHRRDDGAACGARALRRAKPAATRSMPAAAARCGRSASLPPILGIEPDKLRVLSYDVGGNFGTRNRVFVEFGLVAVGVEEARPAGEVHRHPLGDVPQRLPGPRPRHQGGAGAAQGRPLPGDARHQHQQHWARAACRSRRSRRARA